MLYSDMKQFVGIDGSPIQKLCCPLNIRVPKNIAVASIKANTNL